LAIGSERSIAVNFAKNTSAKLYFWPAGWMSGVIWEI
jgi:hypothetical protein